VNGKLDGEWARRWVEAFIGEFESRSAELTDLDRRAGDGDFGTNLLPQLAGVRAALGDSPPGSAGGVFAALSSALMRAGGTSGPLFGSWFREIGRSCADAEAVGVGVGVGELARGVAAGTATVQRLGGARPGDCTMVDAMVPAGAALAAASSSGAPLAAALHDAGLAARDGAESTALLVARRGRASYVGGLGLGIVDPGALTVAFFFEAAALPPDGTVQGERGAPGAS